MNTLPADNLQAVQQLEDAGVKLRRSKKGQVLIADFRECTPPAGDDLIKLLAKLPRVREVDLTGTGASDDCVAVLASLSKLASVNLQNTNVTDKGLELLRDAPTLRVLILTGTRVSREAIQQARPSMIDVRIIHTS